MSAWCIWLEWSTVMYVGDENGKLGCQGIEETVRGFRNLGILKGSAKTFAQ